MKIRDMKKTEIFWGEIKILSSAEPITETKKLLKGNWNAT
jgi:hypothetical protein